MQRHLLMSGILHACMQQSETMLVNIDFPNNVYILEIASGIEDWNKMVYIDLSSHGNILGIVPRIED